MADTKFLRRWRVPVWVLGFALVPILAFGMWLSLPATADESTVGRGEYGADQRHQDVLADTGAAQNQLLILGAAMVLAGGIAAYAVNRHRDAGHH